MNMFNTKNKIIIFIAIVFFILFFLVFSLIISDEKTKNKTKQKKDKSLFITKLPINKKEYSITYTKKGDFFSVMIFSTNYKKTKEEVENILNEYHIQNKVIFDSPAAIDSKPGP